MRIQKKYLDYILSVLLMLAASLLLYCTEEQAFTASINVNPASANIEVYNPITFDVTFQNVPPEIDITQAYFEWDFGDGETERLAGDAKTTHAYDDPGEKTVVLKAFSDSAYANEIVSVTSQVNIVNSPPTASFTFETDSEDPLLVHFDASSSTDPSGNDDIVSYAWNFDDGETAASADDTVDHTFAAGTYNVTLTVTDTAGNSNALSKGVEVSDPPTAAFTFETDSENPLLVHFDASDSSSNGVDDIVSYAWDFDDDSTGSEITADYAFAAGGTYNVTLTVTDAAGYSDSESKSVEVTATSETLVADPGGIYFGYFNIDIRFDGSGSLPNDGTLTYIWNFGDNSDPVSTTDPIIYHPYASTGTYPVSLTVSDGVSDSDAASTEAYVIWELPDTGQLKFYDNYGEIEQSVAMTTFPRQDAEFVEDISFNAGPTGPIYDELTDLYWEANPDDSDTGPNLTLHTYSWAEGHCDALNIAGSDEWRLPSRSELVTIANYGSIDPDTPGPFSAFQDTTAAGTYWTSSPDLYGPDWVFVVDFSPYNRGASYGAQNTGNAYTRCVHGPFLPVEHNFIDNGDDTITDRTTGYMWAKQTLTAEFPDWISWQQALDHCNTLPTGGYDDWRLPNVKQLETLIDFSKTESPVINDAFLGIIGIEGATGLWSSTTVDGSGDPSDPPSFQSDAWYLDVSRGSIYRSYQKDYDTNTYGAICVRRIMEEPAF